MRSGSHSREQPSSKPHAPSPSAVSPFGKPRVAVFLNPPSDHQSYREVNVRHENPKMPNKSDLTPQGRPVVYDPVGSSAGHASTQKSPAPTSTAAPTVAYRGRGRPKGWKPGTKYNGQPNLPPATAAGSRQTRQAASKPIPHPNGFPKKRGRPPKQPSPPPHMIYQRINAPFFAFLCEWTGCKAELHNLETLRRHIYVVHRDSMRCRWGKCGHFEQSYKFLDDGRFETHIEEKHLIPMTWHIGDGPSNRGVEKLNQASNDHADIPDYLKDKEGNQVTPSIRDQQLEDQATYNSNRRKLRDLIRQRDENLPDQGDEEVMNSP